VAALRSVIEAIAGPHGGRVFNTAGDGFMLEFGSSLAAVEAALALAEQMRAQGARRRASGRRRGAAERRSPRPRRQRRGAPDGAQRSGFGAGVGRRAPHDPGTVGRSPRLARASAARQDDGDDRGLRARSGRAAVATRTGSREPLLAVLPFDNLSD
jgi:hypothetical protein